MCNVRASSLLGIAALLVCSADAAFAAKFHGGSPPQRIAKSPKNSNSQKRRGMQHEAPLEQFERMSPAERQRQLEGLPPDRREKLQRQLKHYDQLTPDQRQQLDRFSHLPPERQDAFRKAFRKFQNQPTDRQQSMREEMGRLRSMPESERSARFASPEFQSRYNKNERQILGEMSDILPKND